MKKNAGLTLLELMITIAIIAVVSAIAIPNMIGWVPKYRLQNAASDLRGELQATRMRAIREAREIAAYFDIPANRYLVVDSGSNRSYESTDLTNPSNIIKTIDLNNYFSGVRYGNGNATKKATTAGGPFTGPSDYASYTNKAAVFLPTGLIRGMGYIYLTNNRGDAFAMGTPSIAGTVVLRIWDGADWTD